MKRKISFKAESYNKIMLMEIETYFQALNLPISIDDVINAALHSYLPNLIKVLRSRADSNRKLLAFEALAGVEKLLNNDLPQNYSSLDNLDKIHSLVKKEKKQDISDIEEIENEKNIEEIDKNISIDLTKKIIF